MDVGDLTPLEGGWSGQTFVADVAGERSVVRIYPPGRRDDAAPEIDAAVLHLVRGLVPVAEVVEVRRGVAAADRPGLLVTSFLPGQRGDLLLSELDDHAAAVLGAHLGELLADLAGMPTLRAGLKGLRLGRLPSEERSAIEQLRATAANAATRAAARIIADKHDAATDERLVDQAIKEIAGR